MKSSRIENNIIQEGEKAYEKTIEHMSVDYMASFLLPKISSKHLFKDDNLICHSHIIPVSQFISRMCCCKYRSSSANSLANSDTEMGNSGR